MRHLYNLCCLTDGWHWMRIAESGHIIRVSDRGFESRDEAYFDMVRHRQG
ncbi:hypothetical protein K3163_04325 [Qipengyuania sp. 1NDW9]|nr:hypothetical protein [Qipengyuania xiapuensis]MBX7492429.1 hypothetical protein [Qipengyuania xiapuensis]